MEQTPNTSSEVNLLRLRRILLRIRRTLSRCEEEEVGLVIVPILESPRSDPSSTRTIPSSP